jgi:hypothetical protein
MAKSDTVKARFERAIANKVDYLEIFRRFGSLTSETAVSFDPAVFFAVEPGSALAKAFVTAGLDSSNPYAWKRLLSMFAAAHFPPETRGRGPKWTSKKLSELLSDYDQTKAEAKPGISDETIAELMVEKIDRYKGMKAGTARRLFAIANDPKRNSEISEVAMEIRNFIESQQEFADLSVAQVKRFATEQAIKVLSQAWKRERKITH